MGIFSILAKTKILGWLKMRSRKNDIKFPETLDTTSDEHFKHKLLEEIKTLILKANHAGDDEQKEKSLTKANNLTIQLVMSYEKQGLYIAAKSVQDTISNLKSKTFKK